MGLICGGGRRLGGGGGRELGGCGELWWQVWCFLFYIQSWWSPARSKFRVKTKRRWQAVVVAAAGIGDSRSEREKGRFCMCCICGGVFMC